MRILDIDLDFFLDDIIYFGSDERPKTSADFPPDDLLGSIFQAMLLPLRVPRRWYRQCLDRRLFAGEEGGESLFI